MASGSELYSVSAARTPTHLEPVVPVSLQRIAHARDGRTLPRPIAQVRVLSQQRGGQCLLLDRVRLRISGAEDLRLLDEELQCLPRTTRGEECAAHADA